MTLRPYGRSGWTKREPALETFVPRDAVAGSLNPVDPAYTWSAYQQLSAGLANDYYPHGLNVNFGHQVLSAVLHRPTIIEIEIATGAAGAEVLYAQVLDSVDGYIPAAGSPFMMYGRTYDIGTTKIPAGTRIAWRVRSSQLQTVVSSIAALYIAGHDTTVPETNAEYALDLLLPGANNPQTLVTPWGGTTTIAAGAAWAYGAWVDVFNTAPQDLLLLGTAWGVPTSASNKNRYLALGIGAPGAEVPYSEIPLPTGLSYAYGTYLLRRPLLVRSGERLRAASRGAGTANGLHQFLYQLV